MEKKITKRVMFEQIKSHLTDPEEIKFIDHEIELLIKKNSGERKLTAVQKENEHLRDVILEVLTDTPTCIADIQKKNDELNELSNQRMSALLRQLVLDNLAVKEIDKRKALFRKA